MRSINQKACLWLPCVFAVMLFLQACGEEPAKPNPLLGDWKVFKIDRGGMVIEGPKFDGTEYSFRANGTVFGQSPNGDTMTSRYVQSSDSLTYIALGTLAEEHYKIESLSADRLVLSAMLDAIPTTVSMMKLKK